MPRPAAAPGLAATVLSPLPWRYPAHRVSDQIAGPAAGLSLYTGRLRSASDTQPNRQSSAEVQDELRPGLWSPEEFMLAEDLVDFGP